MQKHAGNTNHTHAAQIHTTPQRPPYDHTLSLPRFSRFFRLFAILAIFEARGNEWEWDSRLVLGRGGCGVAASGASG